MIGSYLAAYRESVPAAMFTVPEPRDWGRRVAPLTPHLVDGSSHFIPAARDRLRAGLAAARGDHIGAARRLLGEAEELTPVTLAPEREAELTAAIRRHTARYGHTEDPAAYLATASPPVLDASERELGWVRAYIAGHPEVREHPEAGEPAAGPGSDREAAVRIGQQAKEAFESGDHQRALALIDEAELRYPNPAIHWDAARDQVRAAIAATSPREPAGPPAPGRHRPPRQATTPEPTRRRLPPRPPPLTHRQPGLSPAQARKKAPPPRRQRPLSRARTARPSTRTQSAGNPAAPRWSPLPPPQAGTPPAARTSPRPSCRREPSRWPGTPRGQANLRPERLLYADRTPLTIRGQGEDGDQALPATAAGAVPAPAGSDYGPGRLQVVRWDDGQYGDSAPGTGQPRRNRPLQRAQRPGPRPVGGFRLRRGLAHDNRRHAPAPGRPRRRGRSRAGAAQPHRGPA